MILVDAGSDSILWMLQAKHLIVSISLPCCLPLLFDLFLPRTREGLILNALIGFLLLRYQMFYFLKMVVYWNGFYATKAVQPEFVLTR